MKISIITPDHRGVTALRQTFESVRVAVHHLFKHHPASDPEVEWLVGWNGPKAPKDARVNYLAHDAIPDATIREMHLPNGMIGNVGALKKALCQAATGDYLLELDSDDILVHDALLELVLAIDADGSDFLFSDAIRVTSDGKPYLFRPGCGWQTKMAAGEKYHPTPPMNARNLYSILHAPDHFRCWRREFYNHIGGHNDKLEVADDFDLLQRTYLATNRITHIEKPLYRYVVQTDGSNTWKQNVQKIQEESARLGDERLPALLMRESAVTGKKILELGGKKGTPGRFTMAWTGSDQNCDLRRGIPMRDDTCVAVYAQDTLEHFETCSGVDCRHDKGCVVHIMSEIHRVLVPGGFLIANTPSTNGDGAWGDPSHKSGWNMWSVNYYTQKIQAGFLGQETGVPQCKFIRQRAYEWFPSQWHEDNNLKYLHMTLTALKSGAMGESSLR